ncbi:MAG: D-hexose-6-phosphate mutarotase [Verrucomicrobiota bacterium]
MANSSRVIFSKGKGGLPKINLHSATSEAEIYFQGAHVTHFQRQGEPPLLFLSEHSKFEEGSAIRGGVPIIFPWFGAKEGKPMHGFARNRAWELKEVLSDNDNITLVLVLPESPEAGDLPKFTAEYWVTVGETLSLELKISNCSGENLSFENCLHTYFTVGDISSISVAGLKGGEFLDKVDGFARKTEANDLIKISGETDRVYVSTTSTVEIIDPKLQRKIIIEKDGSDSTVLWNPWIAKAKAMADFGDEEYLHMVCVESGNVSENKLTLSGGKSASLKNIFRTVKI